MKYLNMFDGQLWLWKTETGESVVELMASYKDGMEKIVVAGDDDVEAMISFVKSLLDMGLISAPCGYTGRLSAMKTHEIIAKEPSAATASSTH